MGDNSKRRVLYLLFFATGICGLIYQVLWARMFGLVFGNTIFASSTVLAAFMAGLALGSFLMGSYISKRNDGLRIYSLLELCVGVFGALMPFLIKLLSSAYILIFRQFSPSFEVLTVIRFILSFILLVIPCTFMGATLPAISKYVTDSWKGRSDIISKLYGINTLGSVFGCFTCGFVLIGSAGITLTSIIAAVLNFTVAFTGYQLYLKFSRKPLKVTEKTVSKKPQPFGSYRKNISSAANKKVAAAEEEAVLPANEGNNPVLGKVVLVTYAFSGFAALALEVGWTRALVWTMGMDSYAFAAMLSVILGGIGIGSLLHPVLTRKIKNDARFLYITQFLIGIFVVASIFAIHHTVAFKASLENVLNDLTWLSFLYNTLGANAVSQIIISVFILFIPSVLMGIAFPLYANIYIRVKGNVGKGIGNIYSVNTMGGIFGSILMGFFIVPSIGLLPSIAVMAAIYFASALSIFFASEREIMWKRLLKGAVALTVSVALICITDLNFKDFLQTTLRLESSRSDEKLLYFKEHATGGVLVKQSTNYGKEMLIDGVQVASSGDFDLHSHLYPAHLMGLLKKDISDVLVVAFGCGGTSGSLLKYKEVKHLDVVEICQGVVEPAKKYFKDMNSNVFNDKRLNLIIQDGKNYVKMTNKKYDIIYSGPIHPQTNQGSAALYTKDYFEDCRSKLKKGGFQVLWLPTHMSSPEDFKAIVKAYLEVYPHVTLWEMPETETSASHPHLIGSVDPIYPDYQLIAERMSRPEIRQDIQRLHDTSFKEPYEFISQLSMDEKELWKFVDGVKKTNTDDRPEVEFYKRPANLQLAWKESKIYIYDDIAKYMVNPYSYVKDIPEDKKADLRKQVDRLYQGNKELITGHSFYILKANFGADVDKDIIDHYIKAYKLIPESTYLQGFVKDNGLENLVQ